MSKDILDDLGPNKKKSKRKELLDQLKEVEGEYEDTTTSGGFLPSSLLKGKESNKKEEDESNFTTDEWFGTLMEMKARKPRGGGKKNLFPDEFGKKKKKKKKDKDELTDFNKEFEREMALYQNLLMDQNKFTESLQRTYDYMTSSKSSARGVNKQMTELADTINSARTLSMQLVEKNVNAKKLIAELGMKERKEKGGLLGGDAENMSEFTAQLLKQMVNNPTTFNAGKDAIIADYDDNDDFGDLIADELGDTGRAKEADMYLKYENRGVTVSVCINEQDTGDYYYIARDRDGNVLDDYPLPEKNTLSINKSTGIATDIYGKKYDIEWF